MSKSLIGVLVCCIASSFAEEACPTGTKHYRITARHIESGGIGYNQGYTTVEAFLAPDPSQRSIIPFVDIRGHVFNNAKYAVNGGFGIRALAGCRVYGANVYYDYRHSKHKNYNQIGFGFESLGIRWDFRANGYVPVGSKKSSRYDLHTTSTAAFDTFQGNQALIRQSLTTQGKVQYAMTGANAEVAFHFLKNEQVDLYAAAGPYYFNYGSKQAIGGQARLGARIYEYLTLEAINSYDTRFHDRVQGSVGINIPLGPRPDISKSKKLEGCSCRCLVAQRLVQDVERQEIIVLDHKHKTTHLETISPAIDPLTGAPYFFVFVDNTSSSLGTYESPYPTFALAEENSNPGDIIYVFPGDGTTVGMDSGITLKPNQQFWGSGIIHPIETTLGTFVIPSQSTSSPTITNTNFDTEGNAVTLATDNGISGFTISSPLNDAIYGTDPQSLDVSFCTFENTATFPIEATFSGDATVSVTNNQFLNNVNGISLTLNGPSSVLCTHNTFEGQTSVSNVPIEISANNNAFSVHIENNVFNENTTGSLRFAFNDIVSAELGVLHNAFTNNTTGAQSSLGSNFVIISTGMNDYCKLALLDNTFEGNTSNTLYLHTSGAFNTLDVTASSNTMSDNGGSGLVLATPVNDLTLLVTDNKISSINDNGIAVIASGLTSRGDITINHNTIFDVGNASNGIAVNQDFTTLNLTIQNNVINGSEGTGIISYAPNGVHSLTLNISDNAISNCQNMSSNASSGLDIEQYTNLLGFVTNNTLSDNVSTAVNFGSTLMSPAACLTLSGNASSTQYLFINPGDGVFHLSPCDVETVNSGIISTGGMITLVESCPDAVPCPP